MTDGNPEGTEQAMATAKLLGLLEPEEATQEVEELDEAPVDGVEAEDEADEPGDEDESAEQEERTYTVKVDGTEVEVTESELLNGYSRQADYTKKTTELAQVRKAFEAERAAVQNERQLYAQYLGQLAQATKPQRPDYEAIANEHGTEAAMRARLQYENAMEQYGALTAEQQAAQRKFQETQAAQHQEWLRGEQEALVNARPEWRDPDTYAKDAREIEDFAVGLGYTPEQLSQVSHRDILVLDMARKWATASDKASKVKPNQGKVLRPGAKGQVAPKSKARKAQERFKKTGAVEDAADTLRAILGSG